MSQSKTKTKPDLTALYRLIDERNEKGQAERIKLFAKLYYADAPVDDLNARNPEDLYGATVSCWLFIQKNNIEQPKVRVFNPDFETHGWQSTHTVIEVLAKEMPFLIDSVRLEINRRQISIHSINACVAHLERDAQHKKKTSSPIFESSENSQAEAIIYMEVDRHTDADMLDDLSNTLVGILNEVSHCVEDFPKLTEKVEKIAEELTHLPCDKPKKEIKEAQEEEAKDLVKLVRKRIIDGELTFEEAAKEFSDEEETKYDGGTLTIPQTGSRRFELTKVDPDIYSKIDDLEEGEVSLVFTDQTRTGQKQYLLYSVNNRLEEHKADYVNDYIKIKELALRQKQIKAIEKWQEEKIAETYIKINGENRDCDFVSNWLKK